MRITDCQSPDALRPFSAHAGCLPLSNRHREADDVLIEDSVLGVLKRAAAIFAAIATPTALPTPWPNGPVVHSTPGVSKNSGWPGVLL